MQQTNRYKPLSTALLSLGATVLALGVLVNCSAPGPGQQQFSSNGQRIYVTATSSSGQPISYRGGPGGPSGGMNGGGSGMMGSGQSLTCVTCHGQDGHGGTVSMMMETFKVPDITWPTLTGPDPDMQHPPYTEEKLKQAITRGLDPARKQLKPQMPQWSMSEQDLADLVSYLKTLK